MRVAKTETDPCGTTNNALFRRHIYLGNRRELVILLLPTYLGTYPVVLGMSVVRLSLLLLSLSTLSFLVNCMTPCLEISLRVL
ncbi:hypothetical protein K402DRAFT_25820 [Aulographum hederae CBS 113979]|uniref:Uncharacterized protein n=1 Tax=Aulographum hederae CBS 113979 TaxID=1176131 RepID=A0A6G1H696_9PEZI|nr:hypothetical protein K402DRAFT_25820 [Aulographum hederae CBS 113979]